MFISFYLFNFYVFSISRSLLNSNLFCPILKFSPFSTFQLRMRTLERKKSSASRSASKNVLSTNTAPGGSQNREKNEFDDLISALRTGDVFGENMDKFRRNRKARGSPPRVDRMDSFLRERNQEVIYQSREKWFKRLSRKWYFTSNKPTGVEGVERFYIYSPIHWLVCQEYGKISRPKDSCQALTGWRISSNHGIRKHLSVNWEAIIIILELWLSLWQGQSTHGEVNGLTDIQWCKLPWFARLRF